MKSATVTNKLMKGIALTNGAWINTGTETRKTEARNSQKRWRRTDEGLDSKRLDSSVAAIADALIAESAG